MTVDYVLVYSYIPVPATAILSLAAPAFLVVRRRRLLKSPYVFPRAKTVGNHTCMWKKISLYLLFACALKGGMALAENFESLDAIIHVDKQIRDYKHDKKMQKKAEKRREREKARRYRQRDKHRGNNHDHHRWRR